MIVKEIVSFFRPQGFACVCSFMTMFRSVNDFDIWKVEVLKALYQDFTRYHVNKLWIFPPERQHKISIKLSHKKYTYAMETLTKKVQVASQTNLADKELQKIVSPYFRNVKRCCSMTVGWRCLL